MKVIIDISEHLYKLLKDLPSDSNEGTIENVLMKAVENGTPISDNATNGDVVKTIFPEIEIIDIRTIIDCPEEGTVYFECFEGDNIHSLDLSWWNALYKAESEDKK